MRIFVENKEGKTEAEDVNPSTDSIKKIMTKINEEMAVRLQKREGPNKPDGEKVSG